MIDEVVTRDCYKISKINEPLRVIIDIGAHIGTFSIFCRKLWPESVILAFEALPESYNILLLNTANRRITTHLKAVTDENGKAMITNFRGGRGRHFGPGACRICSDGDLEVMTVDFSDIIRDIDDVDLLKLDCEGSEIPILQSAAKNNLLGKLKRIYGESHSHINNNIMTELLSATHKIEFSIIRRNGLSYFWANKK